MGKSKVEANVWSGPVSFRWLVGSTAQPAREKISVTHVLASTIAPNYSPILAGLRQPLLTGVAIESSFLPLFGQRLQAKLQEWVRC